MWFFLQLMKQCKYLYKQTDNYTAQHELMSADSCINNCIFTFRSEKIVGSCLWSHSSVFERLKLQFKSMLSLIIEFFIWTTRHLVNLHTQNYIMPQAFTSGLMEFTVLFRLFSFSKWNRYATETAANNLSDSNVGISPKWTNHGMIQHMIESPAF